MNAGLALTPWARFRAKFIGDRQFYKMIFTLVIPVIIQNTIGSLVNLADNVMVGALGTAALSGVAIANHLMFVYYVSIWGVLAGPAIYAAQYAGAKDWEGFRQTLRARFLVVPLTTGVALVLLTVWPTQLMSLYLAGDGSAVERAAMLAAGQQYLTIMLWGLLPFALTQCYAGAMREAGETMLPMAAGIIAVLVNVVFNYLLIFGKLGLPALGVPGAAIATVFSRVVELAIVVIAAHRNPVKFPFAVKLYRPFRIGGVLAKNMTIKGMPLFINEFLWSAGMATLTQILSTMGLAVVGALNIASTFTNLFGVFFFSLGTAVAIVTGQTLGANEPEKARDQVWKLMFVSVAIATFMGLLLIVSAGAIAQIYNTEPEVRQLAVSFMRAAALFMPFNAIAHCSYFAIRSGGSTLVTMAFDSIYTWVLVVPYTYALVAYTNWGIETLYPLSQLTNVLKAVLGLIVVSAGFWARNLVSDQQVPVVEQ